MKLKNLVGTFTLVMTFTFCQAADAIDANATVALTGQSFYNSGREALKMGDYPTAESMFWQSLKLLKNAQSSKQAAQSHAGLGEAYLWQAKLPQAAAELKKAQALTNKTFGADSVEAANILDLMSWLYQAQNKKDLGEQSCRQALEVRRKAAGGKTQELAESLEHLAALMESGNLLDQSAKLFYEASTVRKEVEGDNSINYADDIDLLASVEYRRGNLDRAKALFLEALSIKQNSHAAISPYAPHPSDDTVIFGYLDGAMNCTRDSSKGKLTERITANQVTVEASITSDPSDLVHTTQAEITLTNGSSEPVNLLPQPPKLITLSPTLAIPHLLASEDLAQTIEKKGNRKAGWVRFWGSEATTPITTTVMNNSGPYYGYMPPNFGYYPPCIGCIRPCRGCAPFRNNGMTTITTNVPDWQARARAEQKAQQFTNKAAADADSIRQNALGPTTVNAGGSASGTLNFEPSKFKKAILRIPVGNSIFQFVFKTDANN